MLKVLTLNAGIMETVGHCKVKQGSPGNLRLVVSRRGIRFILDDEGKN